AKADKESTIIVAEAEKKAQIIKGEGDKAATQIWNEAAGTDAEFYAFYRSLEAYRKAMPSSKLVLSPDTKFFDYFKGIVK
ncbi:MAG: protease modulator HflC, partial [Alphaproteobacteria bacterium]|nr:protease modulator HflC [Alphaproteobacteria bacterium]